MYAFLHVYSSVCVICFCNLLTYIHTALPVVCSHFHQSSCGPHEAVFIFIRQTTVEDFGLLTSQRKK